MKLREKTLAAIILVFFITFIIIFIISRGILLKGFVNLEEADAKKQVTRVVNAIDMDLNNFSSSNKDYSSWDETYEYIQDKNERFLRSSLTEDTFQSLKINMIIMINSSGKVVYERGYDYKNEKDMPLNKEIYKQLEKDNPLIYMVDKDKYITGYITVNEEIMMIVSRAILTSNGEGPSRGAFITGRYLTEEELEKYRRGTNISFKLKNVNKDNVAKYGTVKGSHKEIIVKPLSNNKIEGYTTLNDIYGNPAVLLSVDLERDIYRQGLISVRYLTISLLTIGIILIAVILRILDKLIIKRVLKINSDINRITKAEDAKLRVEVVGNDELANLSEGVNSMLGSLELYINKLKTSENNYKKSNEKLKELDRLKTDFLSTVSHELRTPLTSIMGFGKIIKKKLNNVILPAANTEDEKVKNTSSQILGNIDIIIAETERLTAIINDVLDIAKMEAGKIEWKKEMVRVDEVIDIAINATAPLFEAKKLNLIKDIVSPLPDIIGDKDKLIQVVINLLSNAVKFTEEGSVICRGEIAGDEVIVSVIDTGIGIKEEDCESVFERFKQVGDTLINKPKGTGLGLSICKNIIEHHKGRLWVESQVNKGSKFSFALSLKG